MKAIVTASVAQLKQAPKFECEVVDEVLSGYTVDIISDETNGWYKVRTHYNYEGFADKRHLNLDQSALAEWESGEKYFVDIGSADVLDKPSVKGYMIDNLTKGCIIKVLGGTVEGTQYVEVLTAAGRGYMKNKYPVKLRPAFDFKDEKAFRDAVVKEAETYLGTQYRWGGKSPMGIDCSGLTQMSYMLNGVIIFRDGAIKEGFPVKEIPRENLKKGDLLYFDGHIAMYIENEVFIHSSSSKYGVVYNSLDPKSHIYSEVHAKGLLACGSIFAH